jgi:hypothetical protein
VLWPGLRGVKTITLVNNFMNPSIVAALDMLDRDALKTVLITLIENQPELEEALRFELARLLVADSASVPAAAAIFITSDEAKEKVEWALRMAEKAGRENYQWDDTGSRVSEVIWDVVNPLTQIAEEALIAGNFAYCVSLLEVVTQALIVGWNKVEDYLYRDIALFSLIGDVWAMVMLSDACSPEARNVFKARLERWQQAHRECGAKEGFAHAIAAANEGWEEARLLAIMAGEPAAAAEYASDQPEEERESDEDDIEDADDDFAYDSCHEDVNDELDAYLDERGNPAARLGRIRVEILTRQNRFEEAARIALAAGLQDLYVETLMKAGIGEETIMNFLPYINNAGSALFVARQLQASGDLKLAFVVAKHGLATRQPLRELAIWTIDEALAAGQTDLAVHAGTVLVNSNPSLENYVALKSIASAQQWPSTKSDIIDGILSKKTISIGAVDILLNEGMHLEALERTRDEGYSVLEHVVRACVPQHPLAVVPICKAEAERILERAKSSAYPHAIDWLTLCRDAYRQADNLAGWKVYTEHITRLHGRKSSFMSEFRKL